MWEDAVLVMFPDFSFLIWDPVQVEEGAVSGGDRGGAVGGLLVISCSVLVERAD